VGRQRGKEKRGVLPVCEMGIYDCTEGVGQEEREHYEMLFLAN